jgi:hypothetical protein
MRLMFDHLAKEMAAYTRPPAENSTAKPGRK